MNATMVSRLHAMLTILCVTLFTTMALASQEPPMSRFDVVSVDAVTVDVAVDQDHDRRPHLCFQACHLAMAVPSATAFVADRLVIQATPLQAWSPHSAIVGPLLLPPIA